MYCREVLNLLQGTDPIIYEDVKDVVKALSSDVQELFKDKSILVTGIAGFLGSWLADVLCSLGAKVYGVDNLLTGSINNIKHLMGYSRFKFINTDVLLFKWNGIKFDFIIHLASIPSPDIYVKFPVETLVINAEGTYKMLELARKYDAIFLYSSTSEVYGDAKVIPTSEDYWGYVNPIGVRSCYDEGKRFAEALCVAYYREHGLDVRIARIFNTYGPRLDWKSPGYGRVVIKFIIQALENKPITIYGDGSQTRSFCYVSDTVEAITRMLANNKIKGEVINIGNPLEVTINDLAKLIIELTSSKSSMSYLPPRPDDPRRRCPDISKITKLLGWKPKVDLRLGLTKTIKWIKYKMESERSK